MAVITVVLTAALCIAFLHHLTHSDRRYLRLMLISLPFSLIVNQLVKTPLITSVAAWADVPLKLGREMPVWFIALILLNAPVFEEAIKLLPMALPVLRSYSRDALSSLWAGLALGLGFGLGEAIYIAYGIAQTSNYNSLPWYVFGGYASERLIVTFAHGFMTSIAAYGLFKGRSNAILGYVSAVGLHALINLGPILLALKLISAAAASAVSYTMILAAFLVFQKRSRAAGKVSDRQTAEIVYFES